MTTVSIASAAQPAQHQSLAQAIPAVPATVPLAATMGGLPLQGRSMPTVPATLTLTAAAPDRTSFRRRFAASAAIQAVPLAAPTPPAQEPISAPATVTVKATATVRTSLNKRFAVAAAAQSQSATAKSSPTAQLITPTAPVAVSALPPQKPVIITPVVTPIAVPTHPSQAAPGEQYECKMTLAAKSAPVKSKSIWDSISDFFSSPKPTPRVPVVAERDRERQAPAPILAGLGMGMGSIFMPMLIPPSVASSSLATLSAEFQLKQVYPRGDFSGFINRFSSESAERRGNETILNIQNARSKFPPIASPGIVQELYNVPEYRSYLPFIQENLRVPLTRAMESLGTAPLTRQASIGVTANLERLVILNRSTMVNATYNTWRPIAGDGNCFYTSVAVDLLEKLRRDPDKLTRVIAQINGDTIDQTANPSKRIVLETLRRLQGSRTEETLETILADNNAMLSFASYFRLKAASYIRANRGEFFGPPPAPWGEISGMQGALWEAYCREGIETMPTGGKGDGLTYAQEPAMVALQRSLGLSFRVIIMDKERRTRNRQPDVAAPISDYPHDANGETLPTALLHTPGRDHLGTQPHYSILYRRS